MDHKDSERASPPPPIFITALLVGGVAFAVGFFGPFSLSPTSDLFWASLSRDLSARL